MRRMEGFMRGINFGGWMSHGNYGKEHLASFILEDDFRTVAAWGVDHVRIPVDYNLFEEEGEELPPGFVYLDKAIQWCRKYDLNMVLDLHQAAGFSYEVAFHESGLFDSPMYQEKFYALWRQFAQRYGKYPFVAFELLNEVTDPAFMPSWNRIAAKAIEEIRRIAPSSWILVGSYHNNAVEALPALDLPWDEKLVYNFHCYDPIAFTHQGAHWMQGIITPDYPMSYPTTKKYYREVEKDHPGLLPLEDPTPDHASFDADYFKGRFREAVELAEKKNVPLYCGEYGVIDCVKDPDSVIAWYRDIHSAFEGCGIGRAAWSYKAMDFGFLERSDFLEKLIENL